MLFLPDLANSAGGTLSASAVIYLKRNLAKWSLPAIDAWSEGKDLAFGMAVISVIAASFLFAMWLARRPMSTAR